MSERFTANELIASIEWMFGFTALCHADHVESEVSNAAVDHWCMKRHGKIAIFAYPAVPDEIGLRFGLNGRWARLSRTFYFLKPDHAFEFKMRWG
ncbi:MAG: hypothetical protein EOO77_16950 [Oxalobacteraceae bacterium]|nr:MAG: hypothetical protein EOO77_16950 [Oxalobacteraceae bacterium]